MVALRPGNPTDPKIDFMAMLIEKARADRNWAWLGTTGRRWLLIAGIDPEIVEAFVTPPPAEWHDWERN